MRIIETAAEMRESTRKWRREGKQIGLVPTMGYLHAGHISLVQRARKENDIVVVSIFVNPLQFGPKEDLSRYPRDFERDSALLAAEKVDAILYPSATEMYPADFNAAVEVMDITEVLEGAVRPGHFKGVTTVVAKLFHMVSPDVAYFGQKDAQQVAVIKKMVRDLNFPLDITVCPTTREVDGLAMSSRNVYLNVAQRQAAPVLYRALSEAEKAWENGLRDGEKLRAIMQEILKAETEARVDYVSVANPETLEEYAGEIGKGKGALLSMAVRFGTTRLIDNILCS